MKNMEQQLVSLSCASAHKTAGGTYYVPTRLVEKQLIQDSELSLSLVC